MGESYFFASLLPNSLAILLSIGSRDELLNLLVHCSSSNMIFQHACKSLAEDRRDIKKYCTMLDFFCLFTDCWSVGDDVLNIIRECIAMILRKSPIILFLQYVIILTNGKTANSGGSQ
jgi:hypothetical protein